MVLHAGWSSGGSSKFQVSSKLVERFSTCGGRKLPFPILIRPVAYITACTTVQAVMLIFLLYIVVVVVVFGSTGSSSFVFFVFAAVQKKTPT